MIPSTDTPAAPPVEPDFDPGWDLSFHFSPWEYLHHPGLLLQQPMMLALVAFWIWMVVHCVRNEPRVGIWLWILLFFNFPAALVYFVVCWMPGARISTHSPLFNRWRKARQIPRLEVAARNIGNAHQFVELGDAYRETGQTDRAAECFAKALQKDQASLPALWGAAQVESKRLNHAAARAHLEQILARDGSYKFGDVSLAHCRTLCELQESDAALARLQEHVKRWPNPEAFVLLATLQSERGEPAAARRNLETMLIELRGGPAFFARQNTGWARKARRLLKKLPPS